MALSLTVNTDSSASRTATGSHAGTDDVLVPMDPAWSVLTYDADGTAMYARVFTHPSGGGGSLTTETTIYSGNPNSGGGPMSTGRLSASKCGWIRWRNAVGWGLTLFSVSSSGIGTVGSEQTIVPAESFAAGVQGGLYRLDDSTALFVYQSGSGNIRAAHIDHSPGLTISGTAAYTQLVTSANIQACAPIDSTHLLILYWTGTTLNAAIITDSAGTITIGTATTLRTGGSLQRPVGLRSASLDGNGLHPITVGSEYLAAVPSDSTAHWYFWVIDVSGGSISSTTADPANGTVVYNGASSFILGGGTYLGTYLLGVNGGTEASTSSSISHIWPLDTSHQIGTDLGSLSSITPTHGWFRSFDADYRVVSFVGSYTDSGGEVHSLEQTINGLARGGWSVGHIRIG